MKGIEDLSNAAYALFVFIVVSVVAIPLFSALTNQSAAINSSGLISYGDFYFSEDSINWGSIFVGGSKSILLFPNENRAGLTYEFQTSEWDPPDAANFLDLSMIQSEDFLNFTLSVSPDIQNITAFYFLITVTAY